jgi:hypothetical protein
MRAMLRTTALVLTAIAAADLTAQVPNHLCPAQGVRGHAFDAARQVLYVATDTGLLRWNPLQQQFLSPWLAGRPLRGIDVTVDGSTLLACEVVTENNQGKVHRIDLGSGVATTLTYPALDFSDGSYDVVAMGNGKALFTSGANGWGPVRQIDLATNVVTIRNVPVASAFGQIRQYSQCVRSADGSTALFLENDLSSGPAFFYDAVADVFPAQRNFDVFWNFSLCALSRHGNRAVLEVGNSLRIVDRQLADAGNYASAGYGAAFDPLGDRLFVAQANSSTIRILDATTWAQIGSFPAGEALGSSSPQGQGEMSIAADGSFLGLTTTGGVRVYRVGQPRPTVLAVEPAAAHWDVGPVALTVRGQNFDVRPGASTAVTIGGLPASNVQVLDPTTLSCVAPVDGPGPKDVVVQASGLPGTLAQGFQRTPSLRLRGVLSPGGHADLAIDVRAGDFVGAYFALPPAVASSIPGVAGSMWMQSATPWFLLPSWPLPRFDLSTPIPNDAGLVGLQLVLQAMTAAPAGFAGAVWSNHVVFAVQ